MDTRVTNGATRKHGWLHDEDGKEKGETKDSSNDGEGMKEEGFISNKGLSAARDKQKKR